MNHSPPSTVLLVEDNLADACYVEEILPSGDFRVIKATSLAAALQRIEDGGIDVVLLDLSLPDSQGLNTVECAIFYAQTLPIIVLTGLEDEHVAIQAVHLGAQDYILKKEITETVLAHRIHYAIERKRTEEIGRARDRALEASKLKSIFLSNVSHELRTPLSGILGMNEILLESNLNNEQMEYATTVQNCAQELLDLVTEILEISSIELGDVTIKKVPLNPVAVMDAAVRKIGTGAQDKNLKLVIDYCPGVPTRVLGDPERLQQVLYYLASNAVKFTKQGEIRLTTSVRSQDKTQITLKFAISDTGIGIDEGERKYLFMPFSQVNGSMKRRYGGVGLGLAISKRIVELMDGEIGVESEKDKGSTFWCVIPFHRAAEEGL